MNNSIRAKVRNTESTFTLTQARRYKTVNDTWLLPRRNIRYLKYEKIVNPNTNRLEDIKKLHK